MSACLRRVIQCQYTCGNVCLFGPLHTIWASSLNCRLMTKLQPGTVILTKHFSSKKPDQIWLKKSDPNIDVTTGQPFVHPEKGELVYSGTLSKRVKRLKWFSLLSSMGMISALPFLQGGQMPLFAYGAFGFFIFMTPVLLHLLIASKYVTDIYFNEKTKKFQLATWSFFMFRKEMEFIATDVVTPDVSGPFVTNKIKGKPVFINRALFTSKPIYKHMVGYDKPIDLSLPGDIKYTKKENS